MISDVDSYIEILKYIFEANVPTISSNNKITVVAVPQYISFSSQAGLRGSHHSLLLQHSLHTPVVQAKKLFVQLCCEFHHRNNLG